MLEKNSFWATDENGQKTEMFVLFTFENEENGKNYIVYTDNSCTEEGSVQVYASVYEPNERGDVTALLPIRTEDEWQMIEDAIQSVKEEILGGEN